MDSLALTEPGLGAYLAAIDILIVALPTHRWRASQFDCEMAHKKSVLCIRADPTCELLRIAKTLLASLPRSP